MSNNTDLTRLPMTDDQKKIAEFLRGVELGHGMGTEACPCTITASNLAVRDKLTDEISECTSRVLGAFVIRMQDAMPIEILNSPEWLEIAPYIEGTGRDHEEERLAVIMEWMWTTVLPILQPIANENGFGREWSSMLTDRDKQAAADAADAARTAAWAVRKALNMAALNMAAVDASDAVDAAVRAADVAEWAAIAAVAWATPADADAKSNFWRSVDPCKVVRDVILAGSGGSKETE